MMITIIVPEWFVWFLIGGLSVNAVISIAHVVNNWRHIKLIEKIRKATSE